MCKADRQLQLQTHRVVRQHGSHLSSWETTFTRLTLSTRICIFLVLIQHNNHPPPRYLYRQLPNLSLRWVYNIYMSGWQTTSLQSVPQIHLLFRQLIISLKSMFSSTNIMQSVQKAGLGWIPLWAQWWGGAGWARRRGRPTPPSYRPPPSPSSPRSSASKW